jgi:hypothetical protein
MPAAPAGDSSSASSRSKTRSAEATADWSRFAMAAIWLTGPLNSYEYCTNAWTSPMVSVPDATRRPPTTATST